jgi:hypothetical protein
MKKTFAMLIAAMAVVAAACNSTNRVATPTGNQSVKAATAEDAALAADAASSTTLPATDGTAAGGSAGTGSKGTKAAGAKAGATAAGAAVGKMGPGVTATEIKIGINLVKGGEAMGNLIGAALNFGDGQAQAQAVVDYVNSKGGIAGRKIKPVWYTFDLARVGLADGQSEQEACSAWTEDNRVFAAINVALARQALLVCLAKRGVPGMHFGMPIDENTLKSYRDYWYSGYGGTGLTLDRTAEKEVKVFASRGWFGPNAVVGIEYYDDPAYKRVIDTVYTPLLHAAGVKKIVLQGAPRGGTEATSYVVRFRNEGVTNVLFLGEAGLYPLFFMRAADTQGYTPKYGLSTDHAPAASLQGTAPARQLANAIGMGWTPIIDVDAAHDPGPVNSNNALCLDIMRKAGQDMSSRQPQITALGYCHGLFWFQAALAKAKDITVAGLSLGAAGLGTSFASPGVYGTRYTSLIHDGVDAYRDFTFKTDCNCFVYTSPPKQFPS